MNIITKVKDNLSFFLLMSELFDEANKYHLDEAFSIHKDNIHNTRTSSFSNSSIGNKSPLSPKLNSRQADSLIEIGVSPKKYIIKSPGSQQKSLQSFDSIISSSNSPGKAYKSQAKSPKYQRSPLNKASKTRNPLNNDVLYSFDYGFVLEVRRIDARLKQENNVNQ